MATEATSEATTADQRPRLLTNAPLPTNSTLVSRATGVANFATSDAAKFLRVGAGDQMNTGNTPFGLGRVYISYSPSGERTTTFDA